MYLVKTIFVVFGFLGLIDGLFDKFFIWGKIESFLVKISEKINVKILFDLAFCMFCQRFWITVILTSIVCIFTGYKLESIVVPFLVIGMHYVTKKEL